MASALPTQEGKASDDRFRQRPPHHRTHREKTKAQHGKTRRVISKQKESNGLGEKLLRDLSEWIEEFTGNVVDGRSFSFRERRRWFARAAPSRTCTKSGTEEIQHIYLGFPKTKIAKYAIGPKLQGLFAENARARKQICCFENFGDLIRADHEVIVRDLATQWCQSCPCETKSSQETDQRLQKFLDPKSTSKVVHSDKSLEFCKACKDLY